MKRIVKWFAFAGGVIPVLLLGDRFIELVINRNAVPYSSLYGFYLWPTSILLLGSHSEWDLRGIFNLTVSIFANVLLYAIIGLAVAQIMKVRNGARRLF